MSYFFWLVKKISNITIYHFILKIRSYRAYFRSKNQLIVLNATTLTVWNSRQVDWTVEMEYYICVSELYNNKLWSWSDIFITLFKIFQYKSPYWLNSVYRIFKYLERTIEFVLILTISYYWTCLTKSKTGIVFIWRRKAPVRQARVN